MLKWSLRNQIPLRTLRQVSIYSTQRKPCKLGITASLRVSSAPAVPWSLSLGQRPVGSTGAASLSQGGGKRGLSCSASKSRVPEEGGKKPHRITHGSALRAYLPPTCCPDKRRLAQGHLWHRLLSPSDSSHWGNYKCESCRLRRHWWPGGREETPAAPLWKETATGSTRLLGDSWVCLWSVVLVCGWEVGAISILEVVFPSLTSLELALTVSHAMPVCSGLRISHGPPVGKGERALLQALKGEWGREV